MTSKSVVFAAGRGRVVAADELLPDTADLARVGLVVLHVDDVDRQLGQVVRAAGARARTVAVVAVAQMPNVRAETVRNEVEMLMPVIQEVRSRAGLTQEQIGFTCSGSTDYLAGQAFSFVSTLDGVGPWPPIQESHVEMDGAWALYEAWVKLQLGDLDTALVYSYGKSAPGPLHEVLSRQLDPYHVAPLWPDAISLADEEAVGFFVGVAVEVAHRGVEPIHVDVEIVIPLKTAVRVVGKEKSVSARRTAEDDPAQLDFGKPGEQLGEAAALHVGQLSGGDVLLEQRDGLSCARFLLGVVR